MRVIGTAGHIDHGKSTLVAALTGTNPDRLKEERERGMTIDLGFSFFTLPSGEEVGVVDVPGHHRFIKNMLAGVGGVDLALFVVAATESWMPQSEEHLEIIDLLGIRRAVVAITKVDLVEPDWLAMVEEDIAEKTRGTALEGAPVVGVSSVTGRGMDRLVQTLDEALRGAAAPVDIGRPRLWIDRVFSVKGAGTVVTGTLTGGAIALEDELTVEPSGATARVRGLQSHSRQIDVALPGGRVAVNIAGVDASEVERGDALVGPDQIEASLVFNVHLQAVKSLERPLPKESSLKIHVGAAERMANVKLLDKETLPAGETALAQVILERPCAVEWQDRFVLRDPGVQDTVGGGRVLMAPARRVRGLDHRFRVAEQSPAHRVLQGSRTPECLDLGLLRERLDKSVDRLVVTVLREEGWTELKQLGRRVPAGGEGLQAAVERAVAAGEAVRLPSFAISQSAWKRLGRRMETLVGDYHQAHPLRRGVPRETLRSHLGVDWRLFDESVAALEREGRLVSEGAWIRLADHEVALSPADQDKARRIVEALDEKPFAPPSLDEVAAGVGADEELLNAMVEEGTIVRIAKGIAFSRAAFESIRNSVVQRIESHGSIDVGAVRDLLGTTRKYAVPLLEYLDQIEVTRRVGDARVLGGKAK